MKLIMVISADGFVARDENDVMNWPGETDRKIFRLLTNVGGICAVGKKTAKTMPRNLSGRRLLEVSRNGPAMTLASLNLIDPNAWLLGGQTVAIAAFELGLIDEVHLCRSDHLLRSGIPERLTEYLTPNPPKIKTHIMDTTVEVYRKDGIRKYILEVAKWRPEEHPAS